MEDLMDTSDIVSDADFLPNTPMPLKPSGKGAPELLSDMSGVVASLLFNECRQCFAVGGAKIQPLLR